MEYIEEEEFTFTDEDSRRAWEKRIREERMLDARFLLSFLSGPHMYTINILLGRDEQTPLIIACKLGLEEVVWDLLRHPNLDVNIADSKGNTALLHACGRSPNNEAIVSMLLGHQDIQVNKVNSLMDTPLMIACMMSQLGVVKLLLARDDINVNAKDNENYTALMLSCEINNTNTKAEIVRNLLDHKEIDINYTDTIYEDENQNALTMACKSGMPEIISMLVKREELEETAINLQAIVDFVIHYIVRKDFLSGQYVVMKKPTLDITDTRNIRYVIEEAVSNNLPDIARWLLKTSGYLFRACSTTAALGWSKKRCKNFLTLP